MEERRTAIPQDNLEDSQHLQEYYCPPTLPLKVSQHEEFQVRTNSPFPRQTSPSTSQYQPGALSASHLKPLLRQLSHNTVSSSILINEGDHVELENTQSLPYTLVKNLGHGASASVEMVQDVNTKRLFARKIFRNVYARNLEDAKRNFHKELSVMRRLASHRHIVHVYATYMAQRELALILSPVAEGGDLATFLQKMQDSSPTSPSRRNKEDTLRRAFGCLASGLAFMHRQTIRHKDVKPQNILIHQDTVLYTDFGISLDFSQCGQSTTTGCPQSFTRRYCAPEVADWDARNSKSDVFSLGCVYLEILSTIYPSMVPEEILQGPFHEKISQLPSANKLFLWRGNYLQEVTLCMLRSSPTDRYSATEVVEYLSNQTPECWFCEACIEEENVKGSLKKSGRLGEMSAILEPREIPPFKEGDLNRRFHAKNVSIRGPSRGFIDHQHGLSVLMSLVSVIHGDFTAGGEAATLLIFEFKFLHTDSRRFRHGQIVLTFEDASGNVNNQLEVSAIAPSGSFEIHKTTLTQDVHQGLNAGTKTEAVGMSSEVGFVWGTSEVEKPRNAAGLVGAKCSFQGHDKCHGAIWSLSEDLRRKDGIPSFLRSAALLRRRDNAPFHFTLAINAALEISGTSPQVFVPLSQDKPMQLKSTIRPVIYGDGNSTGLDLDAADVDLKNMQDMDIAKRANVLLATLI